VLSGLGLSPQTGWSARGCAAILGATACYGFAWSYMRRYLPHLKPVQVAAVVQAAAAVLLLPFAAASAGGLRLTPARVTGCLTLGLVCTAAAELVNYQNIRRLGPTTAALAAYFIPIVGIAGGVVMLGESIGLRMIVGTAVVAAAVAFARPRAAGSPAVRIGVSSNGDKERPVGLGLGGWSKTETSLGWTS
jgi:drug/metabolite transporter (DMT)-like permease